MDIVNRYKFTFLFWVVGLDTLPYLEWFLLIFFGYLLDGYCASKKKRKSSFKNDLLALKNIGKLESKDIKEFLFNFEGTKKLSWEDEVIKELQKSSDKPILTGNALFTNRVLATLILLPIFTAFIYSVFAMICVVQDNIYDLSAWNEILEPFVSVMQKVAPIVGNIPEEVNGEPTRYLYSDNYISLYQNIYAVNWFMAFIFITSMAVSSVIGQYRERCLKYSIYYLSSSSKIILTAFIVGPVFAILGIYYQFFNFINFNNTPVEINIFIFGTSISIVMVMTMTSSVVIKAIGKLEKSHD